MSDPKSLPAAEVSVEDAFVLDGLDLPTAKSLQALSLQELAAILKKLDLRQLREPALLNTVLHVK